MNYFDTHYENFNSFHHEQQMTQCDEHRNCTFSGDSYVAELDTHPTQQYMEIPCSQDIFDDQKDEELFLECMMAKFSEADETNMDPFDLLLKDIGYPSSESDDPILSSQTTHSSTHMNTNEVFNQHHLHNNTINSNQENQHQLHTGNASNFQSYASFSPAIERSYEMMDHVAQTSPSTENTFQSQSQFSSPYYNTESVPSSCGGHNDSAMVYTGGVFQFWDNTNLDSEMVINLSKHSSSFHHAWIDPLSPEPTLQDFVQEAIHDYKTRQKQNALIEVDNHRQNLSFQERYEFALMQERDAFKSVSTLTGTNLDKAAQEAMRQFWMSKNRK